MSELILALDVPAPNQALLIAQKLYPDITWCKVGLELFIAGGPSILTDLHTLGYHIFLDLKFYDIPHTVARAVTQACALNVELLTVHCQGGRKMLQAAKEAAGDSVQLLGVTALTSFAPNEMPGISKEPKDFAKDLAILAYDVGLTGIVCAATDVAEIKKIAPSLKCLCPGIRPKNTATQDQARIATPYAAVQAGADWLVVGRPILEAQDPKAMVKSILAEMQSE